MHVEVSRLVGAPREKVYAAFTDFEAMPKWSRGLSAVRVVQSEGGSVELQSETVSGARKRVVRARLHLYPPDKVETERRTRFSTITRTVRFDEASAGTLVTASLDVKVRGLWSLVLTPRGRRDAIASATEGLDAFAKHVEGTD